MHVEDSFNKNEFMPGLQQLLLLTEPYQSRHVQFYIRQHLFRYLEITERSDPLQSIPLIHSVTYCKQPSAAD